MSGQLALVVAAHPDDPEFAMGGTVALWCREGWEIHYAIVTDGSKGSPDLDQDPAALVRLRMQEQREAAQLLGVRECHFLGEVDGEVEATRALLGRLVELLRRLRPAVVFTHNPGFLEYRRPGGVARLAHRDHRTVGQLALDAVYPAARDPHNFRQQGLQPHKVREVLLWGSPDANHRIDVSQTLELKMEALAKHVSQVGDGLWLSQLRQRWCEDGRWYEHFHRVEVLP